MKISLNTRISVIGLGYVGLPLAIAFGKRYPTVAFDTNEQRVAQLRAGHDVTLEMQPSDMAQASRLSFSTRVEDLRCASVYIVAVPTPIDSHHQPDLSPLRSAAQIVGRVLKPGDTAIFESTVYPGATEEFCVPLIEALSGLKCNRDFSVGYSPERINPGDREHTLTTVIKVTSGSNPDAAEFVDALYASIIPAGTFRATTIRVAEAAKVIENTQRDLNVALMNELAIIFRKLDIDTEEVLEAAGTKWNFMPFKPGLVGGHCIGVDPYYLTYRAEEAGYHPQVILAGRRINDNMGGYVVGQLVKQMLRRRIQVENARVLIMGLSFKENCPDIRNSKVVDSIRALHRYNVNVDVYDPWVSAEAAQREYGIRPIAMPSPAAYDGIILAVAHRQFREMGPAKMHAFGKENHVLFDLKYVLSKGDSDLRL